MTVTLTSACKDHAMQCAEQTTVKCPLPFGRSVTPVKLIFSSSRSTLVLAQFSPENILNKRCEL